MFNPVECEDRGLGNLKVPVFVVVDTYSKCLFFREPEGKGEGGLAIRRWNHITLFI